MTGRTEQALALPTDAEASVVTVIRNSPNGICLLSNQEIAHKVGRSVRTVTRALSRLLTAETVIVEYLRVTGPGQVGRQITLAANPVEEAK